MTHVLRTARLAQVRLLGPVAALLALGACDYFGGGAEEAAGEPSGEVMAGSLSDDMIPTDDLTSQPPALRETPAADGAAGGAETADDGAPADDATPAEEAAPAADEPAAE